MGFRAKLKEKYIGLVGRSRSYTEGLHPRVPAACIRHTHLNINISRITYCNLSCSEFAYFIFVTGVCGGANGNSGRHISHEILFVRIQRMEIFVLGCCFSDEYHIIPLKLKTNTKQYLFSNQWMVE